MEMTYERAAEILDPEHRENYDSIETVKEACRMGMDALKKQIPIRPKLLDEANFGCPACGRWTPHPAHFQSHILPLVRPSIKLGGLRKCMITVIAHIW